MSTGLLLAIIGAIFLGATTQRIAGIGFAMLVVPFLVLMLGPHEGVLLVNMCAVVSSTIIMVRVWHGIDWRMFRWLVFPSLFGSIPGSFAAVFLPAAPLAVTVGAVVLAALTISLVLQRSTVVVTGNAPKAVAGFAAGLTNSMAGVGGPAVSVYALLARWPQRPFAATLQPFFVVIGMVTIITKVTLAPGQVPPIEPWAWAGIGIAIVAGIFTGERLARHIRDDHARFAVIVIAFIGAATAFGKGLVDLIG